MGAGTPLYDLQYRPDGDIPVVPLSDVLQLMRQNGINHLAPLERAWKEYRLPLSKGGDLLVGKVDSSLLVRYPCGTLSKSVESVVLGGDPPGGDEGTHSPDKEKKLSPAHRAATTLASTDHQSLIYPYGNDRQDLLTGGPLPTAECETDGG